MRKRIYQVVSIAEKGDKLSRLYDILMMMIICLSLVPLAFKDKNLLFGWLEFASVTIFIIDYFLRWITADYAIKKGKLSFLIYTVTPMALIDLVSIFPFIAILVNRFRWLRVIKLLRILVVMRAFKFLRYSKSFKVVADVFKKLKRTLVAVAVVVASYIVISALVMYNVEPYLFSNFLDAIYWATISLTTVGYGDIHPVTSIGRFIAIVDAIFGVVIIALPSGIITAGYLSEITKND